MIGRHKGFVNRLKTVAPKCISFHCVLHRESLAGKPLSKFGETLSLVVKLVNSIKSSSKQDRLFKRFLDDNDSEFATLLFHTESRWLSRGKVLSRVFALRRELEEFTCHQQPLTYNDDFWFRVAYLADIFESFNNLNLSLQGNSLSLFDSKRKIEGFVNKLRLWRQKADNWDFTPFTRFQQLSMDHGGKIDEILHLSIIHHLDELAVQFDGRFSDLKELKKHAWVMNPFSANLSDVEYIERGQEALIDIQSDDVGRHVFTHDGVNKFWLTHGKSIAPKLYDTALSAILPFCTTYLAEKTFSTVCLVKTKARNRLEIFSDLRLAVTTIQPSIDKLVERHQLQPSH